MNRPKKGESGVKRLVLARAVALGSLSLKGIESGIESAPKGSNLTLAIFRAHLTQFL